MNFNIVFCSVNYFTTACATIKARLHEICTQMPGLVSLLTKKDKPKNSNQTVLLIGIFFKICEMTDYRIKHKAPS